MRAAGEVLRRAVTGLVLLVCVGTACTSVEYQAGRLDRHVGESTAEEIAVFFGKPDEVRELPNGETEWTYRYTHTALRGTAVVGTTTCWKNVLRFDQERVLREARREPC